MTSSYWDDKLGFDSRHDVTSGPPVETALSEPGITKVEGEFFSGGQEHFYLEPQTSLVQPSDDGGLSVLSSSQDPFTIQKYCAKVCGLPLNKVVSKVRRIGGGFGGKETRAAFAAACAAAAAHTLQRPVSLTMRRDVDMGDIGGAPPVHTRKYTAAAKRDPANGEPADARARSTCSSTPTAARCSTCRVRCDGPRPDCTSTTATSGPRFRARGVVCKTHTPPNTAFRGFGAPQGMLITEHIHRAPRRAPPARLVGHARRDAQPVQAPATRCPTARSCPRTSGACRGRWRELRADAADVTRATGRRRRLQRAPTSWRKRGLALVPTKYGISVRRHGS